ncbi:hypothetical protein HBI39_234960 [Parastagonospora nodorum]|nr:hypothetical protein HBI27_238470 [Parastagonospora nodorum]KAH6098066.1 hypothetical protein HBI69_240450 [Parastagonospora nodorum]KAH6286288.1 hypothetical protein HBI39_234960 [Parastagonospora nodorum]
MPEPFLESLQYLESLNMAQLTSLAITTIITSWLVVGLAFLSTIMHLVWLLRIKKGKPDASDICVWLALLFGIILVAQTTWAVVDEGSGRHQWDISQQNVFAVAKARVIVQDWSKILIQ